MPQSSAPSTRRDFLQFSALAGGGLVLRFTLPRAAAAMDRAAAADGRTPSVLNAYVRISADEHVTLIMPKTEMGQGIYTSLSMLIAEELEVPLSAVRVEPAPPDPAVYGVDGDQSTGGSTSTRDCWLPLRQAGATARAMLVTAAAKTWGVEVSQCHATAGAVTHSASGRVLRYGELAAKAAALPVPAPPPLKPPAQFRLIGRPMHRLDGADKVYGRAVFGIDASPPGMKYASVALSPVEGGRVVTPLNEAAALAVRGVHQVVNEGDAVAVVADNTWAAMKGLTALKLRWSDGANGHVQQADLVAALEQAAGSPGSPATRRGNVESALAHATRRLDAVYHQPFLAHATMEPMNCTVHWRSGVCEVWVGTQAPDRAVAKLAALGLKPEQVRIHNHLIGGGFGRRLEVDGIVIAARIARHVQAPVKVLWRREEDIQHDRYRPYYVDRISAGLDALGRPVAWRHTIAGSAVSELWSGEPNKNGVDDDAVTVAADPIYDLPNLDVRFVKQQPQGVPTSWWRGVGPTRSVFVVESFIDELATAAGQDPVQYRRALIKDPRARAVLDAAVAHCGWDSPAGRHRGRGVAVQSAFGSYLALVVEAAAEPGKLPRVQRVVCALDCGQQINPDTLRAQLQGGVMFGLTAALTGEITIADGRVQQSNFDNYPVMRMAEAPRVDVHLIASAESPGGVGETGTACAAAALCNAIHAATGRRIRTLPVKRALGV